MGSVGRESVCACAKRHEGKRHSSLHERETEREGHVTLGPPLENRTAGVGRIGESSSGRATSEMGAKVGAS